MMRHTMTRRLSSIKISHLILITVLFIPLLGSSRVFAQDMSFANNGDMDWATSWINHMFRGQPLPAQLSWNSASFDMLTSGLRQALGLYSMGMLILAGAVLFYHLISMVVETAHTGIPFGRRLHSVWAPIRLVIAIGLLVPISGGLSSGQYIVIKIADEGSQLASHAWRTVLQSTNANFYGLITPHAPALSRLVMAATEMELCRIAYMQVYNSIQNDSVSRFIGPINDITKIPADRLSGETWRYSNDLDSDVPLCGEYRFNDYRPLGLFSNLSGDDVTKMATDLANFSTIHTESLIIDAHGWAIREAPSMMSNSLPVDSELHNDFLTEENTLRANLEARLQTTLNMGPRLMSAVLSLSDQGGWIAAGLFIPEIVRLQEIYGELVDHALPVAQEPVLAHAAITQTLLNNSFSNQAVQQILTNADSSKISMIYLRISHAVGAIHNWMNNYEFVNKDVVAPSPFDLRDRLTVATMPDNVLTLFAYAVDASAVVHGVWGVVPSDHDAGYPFTHSDSAHNPFALLSEFGRRQYQLGIYLIGLSGQTLSLPSAVAPSLLMGLGGLSFVLGACVLIFVIPFLIFFRFLLAVLSWMLCLFEAVAAMPLVALAHLTPSGEGLSGGVARQAYLLWISLMLRPVLSLMGLVAGFVFFAFGFAFLCTALTPFAQVSSSLGGGLLITMNVALILLFDIMMYALANASFKGIYLFPDQALRWISHFVVSDGGSYQGAPTAGLPQQGGPSLTALPPVWNRVLSNINIHSSLGSKETKYLSMTKSETQKEKEDRQAHDLKNALFPVYSDKSGKPTGDKESITEASLKSKEANSPQLPASSDLSKVRDRKNVAFPLASNAAQLGRDQKEKKDKPPEKE